MDYSRPPRRRSAHDDELSELALSLLHDWRTYISDLGRAHDRRHEDANEKAANEALERFIDAMHDLHTQTPDRSDTELADAIDLVREFEQLLQRIGGGAEGDIVRDSLTAAMMNLAVILRRRGVAVRLPRARLR